MKRVLAATILSLLCACLDSQDPKDDPVSTGEQAATVGSNSNECSVVCASGASPDTVCTHNGVQTTCGTFLRSP